MFASVSMGSHLCDSIFIHNIKQKRLCCNYSTFARRIWPDWLYVHGLYDFYERYGLGSVLAFVLGNPLLTAPSFLFCSRQSLQKLFFSLLLSKSNQVIWVNGKLITSVSQNWIWDNKTLSSAEALIEAGKRSYTALETPLNLLRNNYPNMIETSFITCSKPVSLLVRNLCFNLFKTGLLNGLKSVS